MKFKSINDFFKLFIVTLAIISLISISLTSCGGGGGGGGGSAAGPAANNEDEQPTQTTQKYVPSSEAEIVSFVFLKDTNTAVPLEKDLTGNIFSSESTGQIEVYYKYGSLTEDQLKELVPEIKISPKAKKISPESSEPQDFSVPVTYTVTAEDNTEKIWTVSLKQLDATQRNIQYILTKPDDPNLKGAKIAQEAEAPKYFNVEEPFELPSTMLPGSGYVTKPNCYFEGWVDESTGQLTTGWNAGFHEEEVVKLRASWKEYAPYVDKANNRIYANGLPVIVKEVSGATMVSFKDTNGNEMNLSNVNAEWKNLSGYELYAGRSGNKEHIDVHATDGKVTMKGGTLKAIYGYSNDLNGNLVGSVNIELEGGTVFNVYGNKPSGSVYPPAHAEVIISGNPTVGDKTSSGIWLNSFTSQIAKINSSISSANAEAITLIANHSNITEGTRVATFASGSADAGKFKLLRDDTHAEVNVNASGNDIVTIGSFGLPDRVTWTGTDEFTVGTGNVNTGGTIFSVFADGGFLTVTETDLSGANFDMGIPLDANNKEVKYTETLSTNEKYRYIQFTSTAGNITAKNADTFLSKIIFHTIGGASVRVRINLETVPITGTGYELNKDVFYLDGSFYKKSEPFTKGAITWPQAYNKAKEDTFNGLQGYLMTITSNAENMFVYDKLFKGMEPDKVGSWIGGTRHIPMGGYDQSTWVKESCGDKWVWASGPEAGKVFYENTIYRANDTTKGRKFTGKVKNSKNQEVDVSGMDYRAEGMYSSWSNPVDCALNGIDWFYDGSKPKEGSQKDFEPNNGPADNYTKNPPDLSDTEVYTDYTGRYVWNDTAKGSGSQDRWQVHYYIVEFTPYAATQYSPGQRAIKTALHAERVYSKN